MTDRHRTFLHDITDFTGMAVRALSDDEFSKCFSPISIFEIEHSGVFYIFSFIFRYFILFPFRLLFLLTATILFVPLFLYHIYFTNSTTKDSKVDLFKRRSSVYNFGKRKTSLKVSNIILNKNTSLSGDSDQAKDEFHSKNLKETDQNNLNSKFHKRVTSILKPNDLFDKKSIENNQTFENKQDSSVLSKSSYKNTKSFSKEKSSFNNNLENFSIANEDEISDHNIDFNKKENIISNDFPEHTLNQDDNRNESSRIDNIHNGVNRNLNTLKKQNNPCSPNDSNIKFGIKSEQNINNNIKNNQSSDFNLKNNHNAVPLKSLNTSNNPVNNQNNNVNVKKNHNKILSKDMNTNISIVNNQNNDFNLGKNHNTILFNGLDTTNNTGDNQNIEAIIKNNSNTPFSNSSKSNKSTQNNQDKGVNVKNNQSKGPIDVLDTNNGIMSNQNSFYSEGANEHVKDNQNVFSTADLNINKIGDVGLNQNKTSNSAKSINDLIKDNNCYNNSPIQNIDIKSQSNNKSINSKSNRSLEILFLLYFKAFLFAFGGRIHHHGMKIRHKYPHLYVANHTSFVDYIILSSHKFAHACISENHGGFFGFLFSNLLKRIGSISFKRSEKMDREIVFEKLKSHIYGIDSVINDEYKMNQTDPSIKKSLLEGYIDSHSNPNNENYKSEDCSSKTFEYSNTNVKIKDTSINYNTKALNENNLDRSRDFSTLKAKNNTSIISNEKKHKDFIDLKSLNNVCDDDVLKKKGKTSEDLSKTEIKQKLSTDYNKLDCIDNLKIDITRTEKQNNRNNNLKNKTNKDNSNNNYNSSYDNMDNKNQLVNNRKGNFDSMDDENKIKNINNNSLKNIDNKDQFQNNYKNSFNDVGNKDLFQNNNNENQKSMNNKSLLQNKYNDNLYNIDNKDSLGNKNNGCFNKEQLLNSTNKDYDKNMKHVNSNIVSDKDQPDCSNLCDMNTDYNSSNIASKSLNSATSLTNNNLNEIYKNNKNQTNKELKDAGGNKKKLENIKKNSILGSKSFLSDKIHEIGAAIKNLKKSSSRETEKEFKTICTDNENLRKNSLDELINETKTVTRNDICVNNMNLKNNTDEAEKERQIGSQNDIGAGITDLRKHNLGEQGNKIKIGSQNDIGVSNKNLKNNTDEAGKERQMGSQNDIGAGIKDLRKNNLGEQGKKTKIGLQNDIDAGVNNLKKNDKDIAGKESKISSQNEIYSVEEQISKKNDGLGTNFHAVENKGSKTDESLADLINKQKQEEQALERQKARLPMLVFPEGTCVNNKYTVLFQKGAFELGCAIIPVAIKFRRNLLDPYWNRRKHSFTTHLFYLMTRWRLEADVWWMQPVMKMEGETSSKFAGRVKEIISDRGGLKSVLWNGYFKSSPIMRDREILRDAFRAVFIKKEQIEKGQRKSEHRFRGRIENLKDCTMSVVSGLNEYKKNSNRCGRPVTPLQQNKTILNEKEKLKNIDFYNKTSLTKHRTSNFNLGAFNIIKNEDKNKTNEQTIKKEEGIKRKIRTGKNKDNEEKIYFGKFKYTEFIDKALIEYLDIKSKPGHNKITTHHNWVGYRQRS